MKEVSYSDVERYIKLLEGNEEWLMDRVLNYAKEHGFTKYASTLQEAWRLSIQVISDSLIKSANSFGYTIPELHPDEKYANDPVSAFGVIEARKHRERGVNLGMFVGLMNYYKHILRILNQTAASQHNEPKAFLLLLAKHHTNAKYPYEAYHSI